MTKLYLHELVEQYTDEGYSPEEAEDMAWKMIQGNPDNWQAIESESAENNFEEKNHLVEKKNEPSNAYQDSNQECNGTGESSE